MTLALAGALSVPSVVFAEATWYGSLRAGVESSEGNIAVKDGESRWGIMGSTDAGEGLTVVYRFEHGISTEDASQPSDGGRLSYVGLSGGLGTLTVGQIWSATYNTIGVITDNSMHYGKSETSSRYGPAISYAFSNDLLSLQIDVIYEVDDEIPTDPNITIHMDPDNDLEEVEVGLSVNIGEIGKVAVAYADDKYFSFPPAWGFEGTFRNKSHFTAAEITVSDMTVYASTRKVTFIRTSGPNIPFTPQKITYFGFRGGLGETGIKYLFQIRDIEGTGESPKPWVFGLSKSLGGGASINFEHSDNDGDNGVAQNGTRVNLTIDF